ncbi:MAG: class I SAM-dependent methyltransferase [Coriobacteriaceae bacterium]|nr:class I SAM-dependent methyltransferase [Coriobacteriaceae bacterium]
MSGQEPYLEEGPQGLALVDGDQVLRADFTRMLGRLRPQNLSRELLVRAARVRGEDGRLRAVDATAGLGEDSLLLAAAGFEVTLFERDPLVAALTRDGLRRARDHETLAPVVARMHLVEGDSIQGLAQLAERPHVVLLDPMFPARRSHAATKKKLQLIRQLEKPCEDEEELLQAAREACLRKVVIKRPLKGPYLAGVKPSHSLRGKVVRYDVVM